MWWVLAWLTIGWLLSELVDHSYRQRDMSLVSIGTILTVWLLWPPLLIIIAVLAIIQMRRT